MGFIAAHKQYLQFNGLVLTTDLASEVRMPEARDSIDASTIGNNWKAALEGQAGATLTVSGLWDDGTATTALDAVLHSNINAGGTKLWEFMPSGSASSKPLYKGNGFVTAYEVGGAVGDKVGFSATIQVSGSVQRSISA